MDLARSSDDLVHDALAIAVSKFLRTGHQSRRNAGGGLGTVLIEDEVPEMSRALRIPERALREKVTCVAAMLGEAPALALLQESIGDALSVALDRLPEYRDASAIELAAAERLLDQEVRLAEDAA